MLQWDLPVLGCVQLSDAPHGPAFSCGVPWFGSDANLHHAKHSFGRREEFGEQQPGSKTLGFLGLIGTKIFLANNETLTNEYAANQIGKDYRFMEGWNAGENNRHHHTGVSGNKQLVHLIEPISFPAIALLLSPDRRWIR